MAVIAIQLLLNRQKSLKTLSNCHPVIAQQAEEFKDAVKATALHYIKEAIKSDRTTLTAEFERQGHKDMADIIRRL